MEGSEEGVVDLVVPSRQGSEGIAETPTVDARRPHFCDVSSAIAPVLRVLELACSHVLQFSRSRTSFSLHSCLAMTLCGLCRGSTEI